MSKTRAARGKGQPDREIHNLFATLNEEQCREKHDIYGIYQGRLRSHAENFEGLKRKWEGFTGMTIPSKKLRTSEPLDEVAPVQTVDRTIQNQQLRVDGGDKAAAKTVVKKKNNVAAPIPAKMPPHRDDKINVDKMLVSDLRKELKKRNLNTGGRKAELQARLREHLAETREKREAEWAAKHRAAAAAVAKKDEAEMTQLKHVKISTKTNTGGETGGEKKDANDVMDVVMEDANEEVVANATNPINLVANEVPKPVVAAKKHAPKSALKPSKYINSSAVQSTPQFDNAKPAEMTSLRKEHLPAPKQLIPTKVSESSTESFNPATTAAAPNTGAKTTKLMASAQKMKISSTLAQTTPIDSTFKTKKIAGTGSAKLQEKKKAHSAAAEARKARIAEMRQKATKPTAAKAGSTAKTPSSSSKYAVSSTLKSMASTTKAEGKPNSILAKMREKAAAEKNTTSTKGAPKPTATTTSSNSTKKVARQVSQLETTTSQPAPIKPPTSTALKSILDPANRLPAVSEPSVKPAPKPVEKPLSPMQTYEMSDREEDSDSESDSDEECENQRPKKSVPSWAQKTNLHRALERQFADGPERLDPDKLFGEVLTCNLEDIFDKKKSKYQRRTSSGNWSKDHVTLAEKITYKRTMGYDN